MIDLIRGGQFTHPKTRRSSMLLPQNVSRNAKLLVATALGALAMTGLVCVSRAQSVGADGDEGSVRPVNLDTRLSETLKDSGIEGLSLLIRPPSGYKTVVIVAAIDEAEKPIESLSGVYVATPGSKPAEVVWRLTRLNP